MFPRQRVRRRRNLNGFTFSHGKFRHAEQLKSVIRVDKLKNLAELLNVASTVVPLVVAVSGWAGSDNPIKCKYSNSQGVIVGETEERHFMKRNDKGEWHEHNNLVHSKCKEVPWYVDDSTTRVRILGGRCASGLRLSYGGEVFEEESKQSPDSEKLEEQGLKMLGVKKYEHVLRIGASLRVVGQAFKDPSGAIIIAKPNGGPFYVTYDTLDELIGTEETYSLCCKYASMAFTVVRACLVAKCASEYIWRSASAYIRRKRHLQEIQRLQESKRGSNGRSESESNGIKNDGMETDAYACRICYEEEYNSVFVPCGHMCCCLVCSLLLTRCPVCRTKIKQVVRIYGP